ncbi:hypothetical protein CY34DRAFT_800647, partial [Suillus luteus UH-Slu-Lm8-n1]
MIGAEGTSGILAFSCHLVQENHLPTNREITTRVKKRRPSMEQKIVCFHDLHI